MEESDVGKQPLLQLVDGLIDAIGAGLGGDNYESLAAQVVSLSAQLAYTRQALAEAEAEVDMLRKELTMRHRE